MPRGSGCQWRRPHSLRAVGHLGQRRASRGPALKGSARRIQSVSDQGRQCTTRVPRRLAKRTATGRDSSSRRRPTTWGRYEAASPAAELATHRPAAACRAAVRHGLARAAGLRSVIRSTKPESARHPDFVLCRRMLFMLVGRYRSFHRGRDAERARYAVGGEVCDSAANFCRHPEWTGVGGRADGGRLSGGQGHGRADERSSNGLRIKSPSRRRPRAPCRGRAWRAP